MMDDWVLVRSKTVEISPPEKPCLFPYLRCTMSRICHRRQACSNWHLFYGAQSPDSSTAVTVSHTDKELEANECRDREEIQLSPNRNFSGHIRSPYRENTSTRQPCGDCDSRSNGDLDSPLPAPLTSVSRAQASSLYQLNYFDDSSEEDIASCRQKENSKEGSCRRPSDFTPSSASDFSGLSPASNNYLPVRRKVTTNNLACTCLTSPQALQVMQACIGSNLDIASTKMDIDDKQELDEFLTSLDFVSLPWTCQSHFGHLPPVESSYPKLDEGFFTKLLTKLEQPVPTGTDSPTHVDPLDSSSFHLEMDSMHGLDISDGALTVTGNLPMHTVRLDSPRESATCFAGEKRTGTGAAVTTAPTVGGIGK